MAKKIYDRKKSRPKGPAYMAGGGMMAGGGALAASGMYNNYNNDNNNNYRAGFYDDYNYRPDAYASIQGQSCTNNVNFDGIVLGSFICPIEGFDVTATMCCGSLNEQYCCTPAEASAQSQMMTQQEQPMYSSTCANYIEYEGGVVFGEFQCPVYGYDMQANMCCGQVNQQYCCTQEEFQAGYQANINLNNTTLNLNQEPIISITETTSIAMSTKSETMPNVNEKSGESKFGLNDISSLYKSFKNTSISKGDGGVLDKAKDLFNIYQTFKNITSHKHKRRFI